MRPWVYIGGGKQKVRGKVEYEMFIVSQKIFQTPKPKTFVYFIKIRIAIWSINKVKPVSKALRGGLGRGGKDLFFYSVARIVF